MPGVVIHHEDLDACSASLVAPMIVPQDPTPGSGMPAKKQLPKNVNRPDNFRMTQQSLPMWEPMLTLSTTIVICFFVAASCLALGAEIISTSTTLTAMRVVYDAGTSSNITDHGDAQAEQTDGIVSSIENCWLDAPSDANSFHANHTCFINITLRENMTAPVYIYYELHGFYQNHRRFVSSMDRTQFTDEWRPGTTLTTCAPMETMTSELCEVGNCDPATSKERQLFPCGIVANTMFNDIFWLHDGQLPTGETLGREDLISKGIARKYPSHNSKNPTWDLDVDDYLPVWANPNMSRIIPPVDGDQSPFITHDYTNSTAWVHDPLDSEVGVGVGVENEFWRSWVETAANEPFRKTYGMIRKDLPADTVLTFAVQSNFYVRSFEGTKALVLSELSWFGSKNFAFGAFFLAVGVIFFVAGILFALRKCRNPRPLGDATTLMWKHKLKAN